LLAAGCSGEHFSTFIAPGLKKATTQSASSHAAFSRCTFRMYGGPQVPTFVQRPHHTTFSTVTPHYILKRGVPRLWAKVGTCGPPHERLRISVFATKCRRQCRSSDRSTGRRQQAPVHYTHASIYSFLSLSRARALATLVRRSAPAGLHVLFLRSVAS